MVLTLTISTLALIVLCYPIGAVILRKPYRRSEETIAFLQSIYGDVRTGNVIYPKIWNEGRDAAETFGSGRGGGHVRATRQRPGGTHKHVISHHDREGI